METNNLIIQSIHAEIVKGQSNKILLKLKGCYWIHDSITITNLPIFLQSFEDVKKTAHWKNAWVDVKEMINKMIETLKKT